MLAKFRTRVSRALRLRHSTEARETACSAPELHGTVKSTAMGEDPFDYFQFLTSLPHGWCLFCDE